MNIPRLAVMDVPRRKVEDCKHAGHRCVEGVEMAPLVGTIIRLARY